MIIVENDLNVEEYRFLRKNCGLSEKSAEAAQTGLKNSLYSVKLQKDGQTIGMGRMVGDGGAFCQIVDICVLPKFQGNGLGKKIMEKLMEYAKTLPESCYISLIADGEAHRLYKKFGFEDVFPKSRGMGLRMH